MCTLTFMYNGLSYWNAMKKRWFRSPRLCRRKQSFGYGDHAPPDAPGFGGEHQQYPPETVGNTVKYISENMTNPPKYKEIFQRWLVVYHLYHHSSK